MPIKLMIMAPRNSCQMAGFSDPQTGAAWEAPQDFVESVHLETEAAVHRGQSPVNGCFATFPGCPPWRLRPRLSRASAASGQSGSEPGRPQPAPTAEPCIPRPQRHASKRGPSTMSDAAGQQDAHAAPPGVRERVRKSSQARTRSPAVQAASRACRPAATASQARDTLTTGLQAGGNGVTRVTGAQALTGLQAAGESPNSKPNPAVASVPQPNINAVPRTHRIRFIEALLVKKENAFTAPTHRRRGKRNTTQLRTRA